MAELELIMHRHIVGFSVFLRLGLFLRHLYFTLFFYLNIRSHRPIGRIATKFCTVIRSCCSFDLLTSDFLNPPLKILNAKSWTKIWHLLRPNLSQFWRFWRPGWLVVTKSSDFFYSKKACFAWTHVVWAILCQNRLRGVTSRSVGEK